MLSISSGHSAEYLTSQVAAGRESYYLDAATAGEPPGRWWGTGAESFGLVGEVDPEDMHALYSEFADPRDPRWADPATRAECDRLGQRPGQYRSTEQIAVERVARAAGISADRFADVLASGVRDEELIAELTALSGMLPEDIKGIHEQAKRDTRQAVSFIDATFSPVKSVTVLHTAYARMELDAQKAGDEAAEGRWRAQRIAVEEAIWEGNRAMLQYMSDNAGYSQTGRHGAGADRWIDSHDWTVASFFQHDSRDHDPQLHIHNAILNRVVCADGKVRTLDSRAIHRFKQGAGAIAERVMEESLTRSLGLRWVMRKDGIAHEVDGVDQNAMDLFSGRSRTISKKLSALVAKFRTEFEREPTALELDRLRRQSTMATRKAKEHSAETVEQRLARWDAALRAEVAGGLRRVAEHVGRLRGQAPGDGEQTAGQGEHMSAASAHMPAQGADSSRAARGRTAGAPPIRFSPTAVIQMAVAACQEARPAWSRAELERQIHLALPDSLGGLRAEHVRRLITTLADRAVADPALLVPVTGEPTTDSVPAELRVRDGRSSYSAPSGPRYATRTHVVAEQALRRAAVDRGGVAVDSLDAELWLAGSVGGGQLGPDQEAAVRGLLTSGARMSVLVGPAGTGKSYVLGTMSAAWGDLTGGRVIGLATSQIATEVLSADMSEAQAREREQDLADDGMLALNTARWLALQRRIAAGTATADEQAMALSPSDMVVVDEASMVDTTTLSRVHEIVKAAGARMVLTGDPRQLASVGAGGVMEMLADGVAETHTLAEVRRFSNRWEREASLRLREGDRDVLAEYDRHGRVLDSGTAELAQHDAARAYLGDTLAGRSSLVVVGTNDDAAAVSSMIRDELVALGLVAADGVLLSRDGNVAGVGDLVQARRNDWSVNVVNRRRYRVQAVLQDGSMSLLSEDGKRAVTVSAEYAAAHLMLGYAATAHSAQGVTVDTAHAVVTDQMGPEALYVAMSRGRHSNTAHVATRSERPGDVPGEVHQREPQPATGVLAGVLKKDTEEARAALVQRAEDARRARSMHTVHALREDAVRIASRSRLERWLDELADEGVISEKDRAAFAADQGTEQLSRQLRAVELAGHDPRAALREVLDDRGLSGARSVAQVTQHRVDRLFAEEGLAPKMELVTEAPVEMLDEWRDYLAELGDAADERRRVLGAEVAADPPQWAVEAWGMPPKEVVARAEWEHRAGYVAAYREIQNRDDEALIGPPPGLSSPERRAAWYQAWTALDRPESGTFERALSDGALRNRVRAWDRERQWQPRYVDAELRATAQQAARHLQDAALFSARAQAAADAGDEEGAARLHEQARGAQALAELLTVTEGKLESAADDRASWRVETAATRLAGERALTELADRGVAVDDEPDRVTAEEWLELHEEAMRAEDPHRDITEADVTDEHAEELRAAAADDPAPVEEREQETDVVAETDEEPALPKGVPGRADVEAIVLAAEMAADEIADRRSQEEAYRAHQAEEQGVRHAAWRADEEQAAEAEQGSAHAM